MSCHPEIAGLYIFENVITKKEQKDILRKMIVEDGKSSLGIEPRLNDWPEEREYGWPLRRRNNSVDWTNINKLQEKDYEKIPDFIEELWKKIIDRTKLDKIIEGINLFDNAYINIYRESSELKPHVDDPYAWTHWIVGLSMGAKLEMDFCAIDGKKEYKIALPAQSVYVMTGDSRYKFTHGIKRGQIFDMPRQVSITFRRITDKILDDKIRSSAVRILK